MFVVGVLRRPASALAARQARLVARHRRVPGVLAAAATRTTALPWTFTLVATVWFAGVCHAFNLLDNMDGLAAGVAFIAAAFLAWLLSGTLGAPLVVLLVALVRRAARVPLLEPSAARGSFMGDCGSLFIGAILAGASLVPVFTSDPSPFVGPSFPSS